MTNLFLQQFDLDDPFNEHLAEKSLMALTDDPEADKTPQQTN
jgi:hypothetical protein